MNRLLHPFFPLLIILPALLSVLSFFKYIRYKKNEFRHLSEFFLSIGFVTVSAWLLLPIGPAFILLNMLSWIWTLRTMGLVCEDISRAFLFKKYHFLILGLSGVISLIFLTFNFGLPLVATPFSLGLGLIGLTFVLQAYLRQGKTYGYLHHANFLLILGFFVTRISYPLFLSGPVRVLAVTYMECYLLFIFCATLYPLYAEVVFERHGHFLEEVIQTRNRQLFSHSGFSEFKILSAGLSHEINNALSIINGRIAMMLRGKSQNMEQDLRSIQVAAGRIVRSIKGLREFIYPQDRIEILDLDEVATAVLALYGQRLNNHRVQVELNSLAGKLIKGKRIEVEQVFLSLINNSVDSIDQLEEKWISVSARTGQGKVEILYQDAGPSKAEKIIPLLEDPFYATHEFMDNDIRLVLAKEIIEKYSGTLLCLPQRDHNTFLITFPLVDAIRSTHMEVQNRIEEINEFH